MAGLGQNMINVVKLTLFPIWIKSKAFQADAIPADTKTEASEADVVSKKNRIGRS